MPTHVPPNPLMQIKSMLDNFPLAPHNVMKGLMKGGENAMTRSTNPDQVIPSERGFGMKGEVLRLHTPPVQHSIFAGSQAGAELEMTEEEILEKAPRISDEELAEKERKDKALTPYMNDQTSNGQLSMQEKKALRNQRMAKEARAKNEAQAEKQVEQAQAREIRKEERQKAIQDGKADRLHKHEEKKSRQEHFESKQQRFLEDLHAQNRAKRKTQIFGS